MTEEEGRAPSPAHNVTGWHQIRITRTTHKKTRNFSNLKGEFGSEGSRGVVLRRKSGDEVDRLLRLIEFMLSRKLRNPFKKIITLRFQSAINGAGKLVLRRFPEPVQSVESHLRYVNQILGSQLDNPFHQDVRQRILTTLQQISEPVLREKHKVVEERVSVKHNAYLDLQCTNSSGSREFLPEAVHYDPSQGEAQLVQCTTLKDTCSMLLSGEAPPSSSNPDDPPEIRSERVRKIGRSQSPPQKGESETFEDVGSGRRRGRCEKQKEVIVRVTTWTCTPTFVEETGTYTVDMTTRTLDLLVQGHPQITAPPQHMNTQRETKIADMLHKQALGVIPPKPINARSAAESAAGMAGTNNNQALVVKSPNPLIILPEVQMAAERHRNKPVVVITPKPLREPDPIVADSNPMLAQPNPMIAEPNPMIPQPNPMLAQPNPMIAEPNPMIPQPHPMIVQPNPMVAQPNPMIAQPNPMIAQHKSMIFQPNLVIAQANPKNDQPNLMITQREAKVADLRHDNSLEVIQPNPVIDDF